MAQHAISVYTILGDSMQILYTLTGSVLVRDLHYLACYRDKLRPNPLVCLLYIFAAIIFSSVAQRYGMM